VAGTAGFVVSGIVMAKTLQGVAMQNVKIMASMTLLMEGISSGEGSWNCYEIERLLLL
jgi:hypothetical protein